MDAFEDTQAEGSSSQAGGAVRSAVPWTAYVLMLLQALAWVGPVSRGVNPIGATSAELFEWGGGAASAVVLDGEWWRLLSSIFLHGGAIQLAFDLLGLWVVGRAVASVFGNFQFVVVFFATALVGAAVSLHHLAQTSVPAGASGAVLGAAGALLAACLRYRQARRALRGDVWIGLGLFAVYVFAPGVPYRIVDSAALLGAFACGIVFGLLMTAAFDEERTGSVSQAALACLIAALAASVAVLTTPIPITWHRYVIAAARDYQLEAPRLDRIALRTDAILRRAAQGQLGSLDAIRALDKEVWSDCPAKDPALDRIKVPGWDPLARVVALTRYQCWQVRSALRLVDAHLRDEPGDSKGGLVLELPESNEPRWAQLAAAMAKTGDEIRQAKQQLAQSGETR